MNPNQIAGQVFKKKRTVSNVYYKQRKAVLFAFFVLGVLPFMASCVMGEINRGMTGGNSALYFPETSKYTVVFETSYGELQMNLEEAIACMLPAIVPADYEDEAIKAQAILLRTKLLTFYEESEQTEVYQIFLEKTPYEKIYFTFLEQKAIYGENYSANMAVYRHAAQETAGMYIKTSNETDDAGKAANAGWFLVSAGSTREGILCEKDYQSKNYYSEKVFTRREFQTTLENLYDEEHSLEGTKVKDARQVKEIHFQSIAETAMDESDSEANEGSSPYGRDITFLILFEDGSREEFSVRSELLCEAFRLVSPAVEEIVETNTSVTITVKGVGHGSGMSLFAANELAKEGMNYAEILNYFFTNIAIDKFE